MRGSTKRIFSLLLSAILLVAAIVTYSNFVVPEYEKVNAIRAEYEAKVNTVSDQKKILSHVSGLLSRYQSIPTLSDAVSISLPDGEETASLFQQVYAMTQASGLGISQFGVNSSVPLKPQGKAKARVLKSLGTMQMNLSLYGSYEGLKDFLTTLARNIRVMDVVSLRISPASKGGQDFYLFNLVVNAYYQAS